MIFIDNPNTDIFELEKELDQNPKQKKQHNHKTHQKIVKYISDIEGDICNLNQYKDPNLFLPTNTRLKPIKILILKILKIYTAIQVHFNDLVVKTINNQQDLSEEISSYLDKLDKKISIYHKQTRKYKSTYFEKDSSQIYLHIETVFRGPTELIKKKQSKYLKYIKPLISKSQTYPFLDIGFGRGEFLELLKTTKFKKICGVDTNANFTATAKEKGFKVHKKNAVSYLLKTKNTFCGISILHVIEHLSFPEIYDMLKLSHEHLIPTGKLIIETPNPKNLLVSSWSFYYDYTHLTKVPAEFLKSILLYIGFKDIKIIYLSPFKSKNSELEDLIYGAREYAIIATK